MRLPISVPDLVHRMMVIHRRLCRILASAKTALNAAHSQRPRMERPLSGGFSLGEEWRNASKFPTGTP